MKLAKIKIGPKMIPKLEIRGFGIKNGLKLILSAEMRNFAFVDIGEFRELTYVQIVEDIEELTSISRSFRKDFLKKMFVK